MLAVVIVPVSQLNACVVPCSVQMIDIIVAGRQIERSDDMHPLYLNSFSKNYLCMTSLFRAQLELELPDWSKRKTVNQVGDLPPSLNPFAF
jgi:hypothetical protein